MTAALAAVVAVAGFLGTPVFVGVLALLVLGFAYGWPRLLGLPWAAGSSVVLALAGLGSLASVLAIDEHTLASLPFVAAAGLVLSFVGEMLRRDGRSGLVESLSGTVGGLVVAACAGGWVAVLYAASGERVVAIAAATVAVTTVVAATLPWSSWGNVLLTVGVGAGIGAAAAATLPDVQVSAGVWLGVGAGVMTAAMHVLLALVPAARTRMGGAAAAIVPLLIGGVLVHVVASVVV